MYANSSSSVQIINSTFIGSSAQSTSGDAGGRGGAVYAASGANVVVDGGSVFETCSSTNSGGGIFVGAGGALVVRGGSSFSDCSTAAGSGGAVYTDSSAGVSITNAAFTGCGASGGYGGAVFAAAGGVTAGAFFTDTPVQLSNVLMASNSAAAGGAVAVGRHTALSIVGCNISSNLATSNGGAVWQPGPGSINVTGSLLANNAARGQSTLSPASNVQPGGGAVSLGQDRSISIMMQNLNRIYASFVGSTFSGNSAENTQEGGAIGVGAVAVANVSGCAFSGNGAGVGGAIAVDYLASLSVGPGTTFDSNNANSGSGGAVHIGAKASADISGAAFTNNGCAPSLVAGAGGGAVALSGNGVYCSSASIASCTGYSTLTVRNSSFVANTAMDDGGGGALFVGPNCTAAIGAGTLFANNSADYNGGALFLAKNASATLAPGVTLRGNSALRGRGGVGIV